MIIDIADIQAYGPINVKVTFRYADTVELILMHEDLSSSQLLHKIKWAAKMFASTTIDFTELCKAYGLKVVDMNILQTSQIPTKETHKLDNLPELEQ